MAYIERFHNFLKSKTFKVITAFVIAINGYLLFCFGSDDQQTWLKSYFGTFGEIVVSLSGWIVFCSLLLGGIYPILVSWLQEKVDRDNLNSSYALVLLETIESVVEEKRKRFASAVKTLTNNGSSSPTCSKVFNTITQPNKQIESILEA
ncbi:hypothetical protein NGC85_01940 [Acinetobacter sp. Z1]|uniref:hypothetical protein n=1 Tax=Acinetobacter sp. Z1 TaxID=2953738 RepID=UPI0020CA0A14|nr:hypothetical protein [Acinetobacter sp. Z1]UTO19894.1 hypothetical protein NGC85_01940 [Acinetobacter sp. Z1]